MPVVLPDGKVKNVKKQKKLKCPICGKETVFGCEGEYVFLIVTCENGHRVHYEKGEVDKLAVYI